MQLTVIIPTYNRCAQLRQVLTGLERQTQPLGSFVVLVVSDGSSDGTAAYLANLATPLQLRVISQPNQGVAAARNTGVAQASGGLVLFLDDDVVPAPRLVAEHLHAHRQHGAATAVLGPMLTPPGFAMQPWVRWEQAMLEKQYSAMQAGHWPPTARQFYTGNTSLARQAVLDAGGFDESFQRAEDVELAYRLAAGGMHFVFHAAAAGYHYAQRSYAAWLRTPYSYGRNEVIFSRERGQRWLLPTVLGEFWQRNRLTRALVLGCVGHKPASSLAQAWLRQLALAARRGGAVRAEQLAYSGIFNLRYYQGIADELGGRAAFLQQVYTCSNALNKTRGAGWFPAK